MKEKLGNHILGLTDIARKAADNEKLASENIRLMQRALPESLRVPALQALAGGLSMLECGVGQPKTPERDTDATDVIQRLRLVVGKGERLIADTQVLIAYAKSMLAQYEGNFDENGNPR